MIDKEYGKWVLRCAICEEAAPEPFDTFQDAVDYRDKYWTKEKNDDGEWISVCPDCN